MISGTVTYVVRMALPPDAAIDIRLEDVSLADAPAKLIAENIFAAAGQQVPIQFQLPYSPNDIQAGNRYSVRARITVGDRLLFTTTKVYPVLTGDAPTSVNLILEPAKNGSGAIAPTSAPQAGDGSSVPLRGTYWLLTELNGQAPAVPPGANAAYLMLDAAQNRYSGSSGCNRVSGGFELKGDTLYFNTGAMTMMACPEPLMTQERTFTTTLQSVTGFGLSDNMLELRAGDKTVAKFKARNAPPSQQ